MFEDRILTDSVDAYLVQWAFLKVNTVTTAEDMHEGTSIFDEYVPDQLGALGHAQRRHSQQNRHDKVITDHGRKRDGRHNDQHQQWYA